MKRYCIESVPAPPPSPPSPPAVSAEEEDEDKDEEEGAFSRSSNVPPRTASATRACSPPHPQMSARSLSEEKSTLPSSSARAPSLSSYSPYPSISNDSREPLPRPISPPWLVRKEAFNTAPSREPPATAVNKSVDKAILIKRKEEGGALDRGS